MTATLKALELVAAHGHSVSVSQCMDCQWPFDARLVLAFADGETAAISHGICSECAETRDLADARYAASTWRPPHAA